MSYIIRVWSDQSITGTYTDIAHANIIGLQIDDHKSSNDDPFEIVGRQAKTTINKTTATDFLLSLVPIQIPVSTVIDGSDIEYNVDYYANLIQILDDSTYSPVFTGLAMRQGIGYDEGTQQIYMTISDSLYIWITVAKQKNYFGYDLVIQPSYITNIVQKPLFGLGNPLNQVSVDVSQLGSLVVTDYALKLPDYRPATSWYYHDVLDPSDDPDDWCRLSQHATIFETSGNVPYVIISYFVVFRTRVSPTLYRCYFHRTIYNKTNLSFVQPVGNVKGRLGEGEENGNYTYTSMTSLSLALARNFCIDGRANLGTQTVTAVWGENFENTIANQSAPTWDTYYNQYYLSSDGQSVTLNQPFYGQTMATFELVPPQVKRTDTSKIAELAKGLFTLWGLGIRGKADGGVEVYPHLIKTWGTGTEITVADDDVISLSVQGTYSDIEKACSAMSVFTFGDMIADLYEAYYRAFYEEIKARYTAIIKRSYFDDYELTPFMKINIMDKVLYLNTWSEPLYDDLIKIECFGGLA